ncbi:ABR240Wp [Eremothecium gossypii ATCC 10895]|uniref:ABR240Wp n=1 Tax=Eremothecium gossypii (strain ATCC 10895 / CBS 109.51 / FGSC 9923 / NRRL Y-1056) TaxID=284811 RepID=Q75CY2_EREGS|nr:ABR240Wp [Eremothecium gossypii ATCC 10895]AAS51013.1 ABR240Wp [Eremothecium gossypii ATCC 10895]AEY95302.1 FABR240Wp [Eremothecium gossypii FDAG1]
MTPATPPRSRSRRADQDEMATPRRAVTGGGLLTPGTVGCKGEAGVARPRTPEGEVRSPEQTPRRAGRRAGALDELGTTARVLFPAAREGGAPGRQGARRGDARPARRKAARQEPGTPSSRIVTFELAEAWHNQSGCGSSDDEGEEDVRPLRLENPFLARGVAGADERRERARQLEAADPSIGHAVTLVDKRGRPVHQRELTPEEQELFKPRMLFARELEDGRPGDGM